MNYSIEQFVSVQSLHHSHLGYLLKSKMPECLRTGIVLDSVAQESSFLTNTSDDFIHTSLRTAVGNQISNLGF